MLKAIPRNPALTGSAPTITETLAFAEPPTLFVGGFLKDGSLRMIPVERGLNEERLKQLLPTGLAAQVPAPPSSAPQERRRADDQRRSPIVVIDVAEDTSHPELEPGDEFPTVSAFAEALGVAQPQISLYLAKARKQGSPEDDLSSWGKAKLHGITFMTKADEETLLLACSK